MASRDVFAAVAVSSTNTYYSAITNVSSKDTPRGFGSVRLKYVNASGSGTISAYYCAQTYTLEWTGTPTGTITVQVSNRPAPDPASDTGWVALTLATGITQPAGSASGDYVDMRV